MNKRFGDVEVTVSDYVAVAEIQRPPNNFFDLQLISDLADAFGELDQNRDCRAIVLAAQGKSFCAGANFQSRLEGEPGKPNVSSTAGNLYREAVRLFSCEKPVVGAIQGPAIGGGLGLALVPDFRVVCPETRFAANFVALGFHPGFGLTYTLPRVIGVQKAALMFYTGRRIKGEEAYSWGLGDVLTSQEKVRDEAVLLAREIAANAPIAVVSTRATMRKGLAEQIMAQTNHELQEQSRHQLTDDFREGLRAVAERRPGNFQGQ